MSAARKKALADPAVRAKMEKQLGWLSPAERVMVVADIRSKRRYVDIANDWLVTEGTICRIAKKENICRRPRGGRSIEAAA